MDRYIEQLIEELGKAEANPLPEPDLGNSYEEFETTMLKIEKGEKTAPENLINVSYEELPPAEMLSKMQIQKLLIAIFNALSAKGTKVSIPGNGVPVGIVYEEIRDMFKEGIYEMPGWTIDFCSGWCPECKFADYCESCKEIWTKEELGKEKLKVRKN
jgi:hypothetical protein